MKPHYRIMGNYRNSTEEIDNADDEGTARYLQGEYQLAYGSDWQVWVEVQTFDKHGNLDECIPLDES